MDIETQCALEGDSGPSIVCEMYTYIDNCKYHHISICIGFYEEVLTKTSTYTLTLWEETNRQYFIAIPLGDWPTHWIFFPYNWAESGTFFLNCPPVLFLPSTAMKTTFHRRALHTYIGHSQVSSYASLF